MADLIHPFPRELLTLQGSVTGNNWPGLSVRPVTGGVSSSISFTDRVQRKLIIQTQPLTLAQLSEVEAWLKRIRGGAFSYTEPVSAYHPDLDVHGTVDGTNTTFRIPVYLGSGADTSGVSLTVDGVPQDPADYVIHPVANLAGGDAGSGADQYALTEDDTAAADGNWAPTPGSTASIDWSEQGPVSGRSVKVTPNGAGVLLCIPRAAGKSAAVDTLLLATGATILVGVMDVDDVAYRIRIRWREGEVVHTNDTSSDLTHTAGVWSILECHGANPGGLLSPSITAGPIMNDGSSTEPFYFSLFGVCPGTYNTWHLPSQAPAVVEFDTAPVVGSVIKARATGKRWSKLVMDGPVTYQHSADGRSSGIAFSATESME